MPFSSIADLKKSALWGRMTVLHDMSSSRLRKFISTFNAVLARATRGGASEDEAEARAIPIGLSAARNARAIPAGRVAEEQVHVYALMARDMLHSGSVDGDVDTDLSFPDPEDLNAAFAGTAFNTNHDALDPVGVIHRFASRDALEPELRGKVDPDIMVVALASFFEDVPVEERHASISPEWTTFRLKDGSNLAVPHTFAVTANPANDPVLGIKQVAVGDTGASGGVQTDGTTYTYIQGNALPGTMGDEPEKQATLETKLASLTTLLEEEREKRAGMEEKLASFDEVKQRLAALAGEKTPAEELDAKTVIASLDKQLQEGNKKVASLEKQVEELVTAGKEAQAEAFADDVFRTKQISHDRRDFWASFYLKDPEQAQAALADIGDRDLPAGESKAIHAAPETDNPEEMEFLASAFGPGKKREAN